MKNKTKLIFLPVLLAVIFLSAFAQPVPLFATPLPEGRSLDETHNTGYIDWHGAVGYINLFHRDGICSSGCTEQVTRIINGASVSGAFAADVDYFEVGVSASHSSIVGSAVLTACSSSDTLNLHTAGSGPPGFVSFSLAVPAGCRTWSLTAAGGYVDFRSVDANYGTPPPAATSTKSRTPTRMPPSTVTATPLMTKTPTKTVTIALTPTLTITATASPSNTMTITLTPTASETLAPGVTPSKTPIPTITYTPSASATFTTTPTASKTIILTGTYTLSPSTVTPIYTRLPSGTNTPAQATTKTKRPPRNHPTATIAFASASRTAPPSVQTRTFTPPPAQTRTPTPPSVLRTPTFSSNNVVLNATPTPICGPSAPGTGGFAGGASFDFSWLGLLTAAGSLAAALSLLRSLQQGSSSSLLNIRVPHLVQRKTTVGEWVSTPVKVWVLVTSTVWRAVVEAIPHFIDVLRQVVDQIFHSEWVTSTVWVLQTIYQNVWEQVPLLSWLGTIIGWLWQWVLKPVLTWVAQTIQTLYTWVENVVRWVVERIQDGWDYITHWVAETISKWVEQTDWVQKWVTKEITVWDTEWETVPVPLPAALSAANLKILAKLGITITLGIISLTQCTPTSNPLPTPDAIATQVACIRTQVAATAFAAVTQTAVAGYTPTPIPTATTLVDTLKTEKALELLSQWLSDHRNDPAIKQWLIEHGLLNSADANDDAKVLDAIGKAVVPWQNQYNDDIQRIANEDGIPADYLKALFLHENQLGWTPVLDNPNANGPGQLFGWGLDMAFNSGNAPSTYIKEAYERSGQIFYDSGGSPITPDAFKDKDGSINYQLFYKALSLDSQTTLRGFAIPFVNDICDNYETCPTYGGLKPDEAIANLEVSGQAFVGAENIAKGKIEPAIWNKMSESDQMKFTIAIYNSGGGSCVGDAIEQTRNTGGNPGNWDQVKANLGLNCKAAGAEVDGVFSNLP